MSEVKCTFCGEDPHPIKECPACMNAEDTRKAYLDLRSRLADAQARAERAEGALRQIKDAAILARGEAGYELDDIIGYASEALTPSSQRSDGERPLVVCLCGSSRHPDIHLRLMMDETLAGRIVVPMGLYGHADFPPGAKAATNDGDESTAVKQMLDALHYRKIDLSDEVVIVRVNGYVGSSTRRELEYAASKGKTVRFHDVTAAATSNAKEGGEG